MRHIYSNEWLMNDFSFSSKPVMQHFHVIRKYVNPQIYVTLQIYQTLLIKTATETLQDKTLAKFGIGPNFLSVSGDLVWLICAQPSPQHPLPLLFPSQADSRGSGCAAQTHQAMTDETCSPQWQGTLEMSPNGKHLYPVPPTHCQILTAACSVSEVGSGKSENCTAE